MDTPYFREGAGSIIYHPDGQVLVFKRTDKDDLWQFQQGGTDDGETPEETLWRELKEETALDKSDFLSYQAYPHKTTYNYPKDLTLPPRYKNCLGQTHHWWFLAINPETTIDLNNASDKEFSAFKWVTFEKFLQMSDHSFKQAVYRELYDYYITHILPKS